MLRFSSDRLSPGMVVGRTIIDPYGLVPLTAGQILNEKYVRRIQELKIPMVYIDDQMGVEESPPLVDPVTISNATNTLKQSYQECAKTGKIDLRSIQSMLDNIIDDLLTNSNLLIGMTDLKSHDDYTCQHSVNVAILAIMLGINNGYNHAQLRTLGAGAILHDIGKIKIPLEILNKPGALTYEEYIIIKRHPWAGFKMIEDSTKFAAYSVKVAIKAAAKVIMQHHERIDGKGYPRGISGRSIHEFGLIAAVADIFDALVSDRPYRRGYNNLEAMQIIEKNKGIQLSPYFVDLLFQHINLYPPGTVVTLTTGDMAIVTRENPQDRKAPQVKLLFNAHHQVYDKDRWIDLAADRTISIDEIQNPEDTDRSIALYLSLKNKEIELSTTMG